jgi:hypothetical protein
MVLEYIEKVTELGLTISDAISAGLGLEKAEVRRRVLEPEPIQLFRAFKYSKGRRCRKLWHWRTFRLRIPHYPFAKCCRSPSLLSFRRMGRCTPDSRFVCGERWAFTLCSLTCFVANSNAFTVGDILDRLTSGLYILHLPTPPCSTTIAYVRAAFHPILLSIPLGQLKSSPFRSPPSLAASSPIQRHRNAGNIGRCSIVSKVLGEYTLV